MAQWGIAGIVDIASFLFPYTTLFFFDAFLSFAKIGPKMGPKFLYWCFSLVANFVHLSIVDLSTVFFVGQGFF